MTTNNSSMQRLSSSYRDPAGFIFLRNDKVYRFISKQYEENYRLLMDGGLYQSLISSNQLIPHEEVTDQEITALFPQGGRIILPEQIPFISYPYEWSFNMWKDAAMLTLSVAVRSLENGMMLKDATPFNIQFYKGRPVLIDTLSFEKYEEGKPWVAYRQFCETMLAPLLLMHYCHRDAARIFLSWPDGIPLEVLQTLLPRKAKWNLHVYLHILLPLKAAQSKKGESGTKAYLSKQKLLLLLKGLKEMVKKLSQKKSKSVWDDYYSETISGRGYIDSKKEAVRAFAEKISFDTITDLGSNDGYFSLLLKDKAKQIVAVDADSNCIDQFYLSLKKEGIQNITPVVNQLNNPSPAIGWANKERDKLEDRIKADLVLALALVHHLAISSNLPLTMIADWFSSISTYLIIEFIPQEDEKVQQLLAYRENIFGEYNAANFREVFSKYFRIIEEREIKGTTRLLFLMEKK